VGVLSRFGIHDDPAAATANRWPHIDQTLPEACAATPRQPLLRVRSLRQACGDRPTRILLRSLRC
jgi:hypothetical protein